VITTLVAVAIAWLVILAVVVGMVHAATSPPAPRVPRRRHLVLVEDEPIDEPRDEPTPVTTATPARVRHGD
jgi:hypothetical protein